METLKWLWACYLARRYTRRRNVLYSERKAFMQALRPQADSVPNCVIAYPDAWLRITPGDVKRAKEEMLVRRRTRRSAMTRRKP